LTQCYYYTILGLRRIYSVRIRKLVFLSSLVGLSTYVGFLTYGVHQALMQPPPEVLLQQLLISDSTALVSFSNAHLTTVSKGSQTLASLPTPGVPSSLGARLSSFQSRPEGIGRPFRIVQFGDSHTAGDFFTEQLRRRLQAKYGDGGIGWIIPAPVPGQSSARYNVQLSGDWLLKTSRSKNVSDLPLGGFINTGSVGSKILVEPVHKLTPGRWRFGALVRSKPALVPSSLRLIGAGRTHQNFSVFPQWTPVELSFSFITPAPFILQVVSGRVEVAGLWIEREVSGVVVDHIGRNGATLSAFDRWSDDSIFRQLDARPVDAILLAYGTNESMDNLTSSAYVSKIYHVIRRIQLASPTTPIILLTAPSFAANLNMQCGQFLPPSLRSVIRAQMASAILPGVQVWNWMHSMGGECAVADWSRQGLMRADRIHMTPAGYRLSADLFYSWLQNQIPSHP